MNPCLHKNPVKITQRNLYSTEYLRIDFQFACLRVGSEGGILIFPLLRTGINATVESLEALNPLDEGCPWGQSLVETKVVTCLLVMPVSTWKLLSVVLRNQSQRVWRKTCACYDSMSVKRLLLDEHPGRDGHCDNG